MITTFRTLSADQTGQAGGKGRALALMLQKGYPVPDGFILLPDTFNGDELRPEEQEKFNRHLADLRKGKPGCMVAVRSSALAEDAGDTSFAGEFETVLNLTGEDEIGRAVRTVRESRHAHRVGAYQTASGLAAADQEMAVVIQLQVQTSCAGVLFTADPVSGDRMRMVGNYVAGAGEQLVSGQVNPFTFEFERPSGRYQGGNDIRRAALQLYRLACRLEREFGQPQDIEWGIADGRLYILQSRPITTLKGFKPATAEWNDSQRGRFLWTGANLAENAPHVMTPFTCSTRTGLALDGLDLTDGSSLGVDGYPLSGIIGGRAYLNLSVQVSAIRPFFGGNTRKALEQITAFWGGVPEGVDVPLVPISTWHWLTRVLPAFSRYGKVMADARTQIPAYIAENPARVQEMCAAIEQIASPGQLIAMMDDQIKPYSLKSFFLTFGGAADLPNRVEKELTALIGTEDTRVLMSNLSGQSGGLESLGPMLGLERVLKGDMSREAYMQQYGHRGVDENEFAWARPVEDPDWLDRRLEEFARSGVDLSGLFARQKAAADEAMRRLREKKPGRVKRVEMRLKAAADAAALRERIRSEATRGALVIRKWALKAGELSGLGGDIFYLTMDEVYRLLRGDKGPRDLIPDRKKLYRRYAELPAYPTLIVGRFDPFQWAADPNRRTDLFVAGEEQPPVGRQDADLVRGFPGAQGVVEGRVRKLASLEQSAELVKGEILVATMTNIGWTPIFPLAGAIVTDLGAPLSHAAIVAREMGLPAVVGCGDATMRLSTGDLVRVDGARGTVEILQRG